MTDRIKVLIIDDETEFSGTLSERLAMRDFESRTAEGAAPAIEMLTSGWSPDVVVLDLKMPGTDGLATLGLLKRHDPSIEVIMLTGHGSTSSGIEGMKSGLFDYLLKPIDIDDLIGRIRDAVEKKHAGG